MPPTFRKPMHTAGQADISSCQTTTQFPATMVRSLQFRGHVICGGRRNQSSLHQLQRSHPGSAHTWILRAKTTTHTNSSRQHYRTSCGKQQHYEKLKVMDMKYHWLRCRINQRQFRHYWVASKSNNGNCVTKHHSPIHHQATRPTFLSSPITILQKQLPLIHIYL